MNCAAYAGRSDKGACGQAAALRWSGLRCAPTSLRCSVLRPRRQTHCAHCVRSVQTMATRHTTKRAARAAASPGLAGRAGPSGPAVRKAQTVPRTVCVPAHLLGGPEGAPRPARKRLCSGSGCVRGKTTTGSARQAVPGGGDFWSAEERSLAGGARSALRCLTHRRCLNGESAANAVSSAMRPRGEHRSGVGAQRRPLQHEPAPGTACRAAAPIHAACSTQGSH